jgi:thioredoxin reductase (NADPH)
MSVRDLLIIGGGPSGLAAAIAARKHGLDYQVIEQGVLVNSIYRFPPLMVFFTTPELLEIGGLPFVSPYDKPTRQEALRYYRRVVDVYDLQIAYHETVTAVRHEGPAVGGNGGVQADDSDERVFEIESQASSGVKRVRRARTVVFAIGYYDHPVMLGITGEDLSHVHHYYTDPHLHHRQRVVVVGGGNSAAEAALEMFRAGAKVTVVHRRAELKSTIKYWVRPDIENRIREGSIAARFNSSIKEIRATSAIVEHGPSASDEEIPADAVYLLTGYRADSNLMCRAGVRLNEREAPVHDPETFETNVPGIFIAGGAIAGVDTGTIFIENGRYHGEKIVDVIRKRLQP